MRVSYSQPFILATLSLVAVLLAVAGVLVLPLANNGQTVGVSRTPANDGTTLTTTDFSEVQNHANVSASGSTTSTTSSSLTSAVATCGHTTSICMIGNFTYYSEDVSNYIIVQNPGYSYFLNGSLVFMGVRFQTICPSNYVGCPNDSGNQNQSRIALYAAAIGLNLTFPDKSTEAIGTVIGDSRSVLILSNHVGPKAGILIQYTAGRYSVSALVEYPRRSS